MGKGFEKGEMVTTYDNNKGDFMYGTLIDSIMVIEDGILELWELIMEDGTKVIKPITKYTERPSKNGDSSILF